MASLAQSIKGYHSLTHSARMMAERSTQSTSEATLSWREELVNLVLNPPREKPGPKQVMWADLCYRLPVEPKPIPGRPKSCMKVTQTNFDSKEEPYCSLRSQSRPLASPWRDEVRNRWSTPGAPERAVLSRLRHVHTCAPNRILRAFLKLTETKRENLAETGTFLVDPVRGPEPGRVAWPDTPMIQRHYTPTVERNLQEILQQTFREAGQLRDTALIKPGRSPLSRCGIWLKEKALGRPTPNKSCLKQAQAESVSEDQVRYLTCCQIERPAQAELDTELRAVTFVSECDIDLI